MADLQTAAQQALEALKSCSGVPHWPALQPTILALRAALAQQDEPVQEPVAWLIEYDNSEREVRFVAGTRGITQTPLYAAAPTAEPVAWMTDRKEMYFDKDDAFRYSDSIIKPLYADPPQRKPLTEEEIGRICDAHWSLRQLARAVERAHGIKE